MKHIQNWCTARGGCLTEGVFQCEMCGGWLCRTHLHALTRRYDNQTTIPTTVKVGNYTKTFPANTAGLATLLVCQECGGVVEAQPPWTWVGTLPLVWPSSTPVFPPIQKTPARRTVKIEITNLSVGEIRTTPKPPKVEKPPEPDPQLQRLLDLLDQEVL